MKKELMKLQNENSGVEYVVHHKSEDKEDYRKENLEILPKDVHSKIHSTGRKHSEKTRMKISEANKSKIISEETRKKLSIIRLGKKLSDDHIAKIRKSSSNKGLFGFTGTRFKKNKNPEKKCWDMSIYYKGNRKFIGLHEDPLTANLVYELVKRNICIILKKAIDKRLALGKVKPVKVLKKK